MHILFVCTGNICRSPTAERLVRAYAGHYLADPSQLTASSAGTRAVYGSGIEPNAARVLVGLGGSPADFAARQVQPEDVTSADVVLAMTGEHRTTVLSASPRALQRSFTLLEARALLDLVPREELPPSGDLTARGKALVKGMARRRGIRPTPRSYAEFPPDDVEDPIGLDPETFRRVGGEIAEALTPWLDVLTDRERS